MATKDQLRYRRIQRMQRELRKLGEETRAFLAHYWSLPSEERERVDMTPLNRPHVRRYELYGRIAYEQRGFLPLTSGLYDA